MLDPAKLIDVSFPARGQLPVDHGYILFSALCEALPLLAHEPGWALHLVDGVPDGDRLRLGPNSAVQLRLPASDLGEVLGLTGRSLPVGLDRIGLGVAHVKPLTAAPRLRAVVALPGRSREAFEPALRHELATFPLEQDPDSIAVTVGSQRMLRARVRTVVAYEVELDRLRPSASLCIQAHGIGARRHMGAGVFTPAQ